MGIALVQLLPVYLGRLHSIEIDFLVDGVSVQYYQGPWGTVKGVTSVLSPSGMDSAVPGWAGVIRPYSRILGWLRRRGYRWL